MIRHPNYSGMQMDQVTRLYVPAHFVKSVRIWQGDDLLLAIESGISIAENPEFRFDYHPNGATGFRAEMEDNEGESFTQEWSAHGRHLTGGFRSSAPRPRPAPPRDRARCRWWTRCETPGRGSRPPMRRMRSTVSAFSYLS